MLLHRAATSCFSLPLTKACANGVGPGDFHGLPPSPRHSLAPKPRNTPTSWNSESHHPSPLSLQGMYKAILVSKYGFALGLGLGRLGLGGISSQVRFCPQRSPPFQCLCRLSRASVSFIAEFLLLYLLLCILFWIGLNWSSQLIHPSYIPHKPSNVFLDIIGTHAVAFSVKYYKDHHPRHLNLLHISRDPEERF